MSDDTHRDILNRLLQEDIRHRDACHRQLLREIGELREQVGALTEMVAQLSTPIVIEEIFDEESDAPTTDAPPPVPGQGATKHYRLLTNGLPAELKDKPSGETRFYTILANGLPAELKDKPSGETKHYTILADGRPAELKTKA